MELYEDLVTTIEEDKNYLAFVDDANELIIKTMVQVYVKLEKSGDGYNTPHDITVKSDVHSIEYHCFDFDGKRVIDEDGVICKELEKIIKLEYEN